MTDSPALLPHPDFFAGFPSRVSGASQAEIEAECDRWLARLRQALAAPDEATAALCEQAVAVLSSMPATVARRKRVDAWLVLSQIHYLAARAPAALEPAHAAVELAQALGDPAPLRLAWTICGVIEMENGNLPAATSCFSAALQAAQQLPDAGEASSVWVNLGLALQRSALNAEAMQCYRRALELSEGSAPFAAAYRAALSNIAGCAVHLEDVRSGLQAAQRAIEINAEPRDAASCLSRAIAEGNQSRLLLQIGQVDAAAAHAEQARLYGSRVPSGRGELVATLARGLVEVHRNQPDAGLPLLKRALELARRQVPSEVRDTLDACIDGYRRAGQHDVALVYLHELLAMNRQARAQQVVMQHREHLARLERMAGPLPRAGDAAVEHQRGALRDGLQDRELVRNRMLLLEQQSVAAELHDDTTGEHCYRVGRLAALLGHEIGLEEHVCFLIDLAARLHDIGKLVVPDAILLKPGRLTDGERSIMQTHTTAGAEILAKSNVPQMHIAEEIALHHHERWDGLGYPMALAGARIPIAARVSALADVFDALTHARPYKAAWPVADALAEIARLRGVQFDPELTDVFLALVPRLQRRVGDLDAHLGAAARSSPFVQARRQIADALKGNDPGRSLFDLRR